MHVSHSLLRATKQFKQHMTPIQTKNICKSSKKACQKSTPNQNCNLQPVIEATSAGGFGLWLRCRAGGAAGLLCRAGMWPLGIEAVGQAMSCKNHAKTMQKPCKNHAKTMQKPCKTPNPHSPRVPCYMCYMCYISQGKPLNIHSPRVPCYMCYMCYVSQGKPLNIHSPPSPCYMCYMCYSTYTTDFRACRIYSTYSTYSKELGESGCSAAWRVRYSTAGWAKCRSTELFTKQQCECAVPLAPRTAGRTTRLGSAQDLGSSHLRPQRK